MAPDKKLRLVADGTDGIEGRALMLVSALHRAARALAAWEILFVGASDGIVRTAIEALCWDTGLAAASVPEGKEGTALSGADLFAAICFRDTAHLPLARVAACNVPMLVAVQFPDSARHGAAVFALQRAAHDPELFAAALVARSVGS